MSCNGNRLFEIEVFHKGLRSEEDKYHAAENQGKARFDKMYLFAHSYSEQGEKEGSKEYHRNSYTLLHKFPFYAECYADYKGIYGSSYG